MTPPILCPNCQVPLWRPPGIPTHDAVAVEPERRLRYRWEGGEVQIDLVCEFGHTWALLCEPSGSGETLSLARRTPTLLYGEMLREVGS